MGSAFWHCLFFYSDQHGNSPWRCLWRLCQNWWRQIEGGRGGGGLEENRAGSTLGPSSSDSFFIWSVNSNRVSGGGGVFAGRRRWIRTHTCQCSILILLFARMSLTIKTRQAELRRLRWLTDTHGLDLEKVTMNSETFCSPHSLRHCPPLEMPSQPVSTRHKERPTGCGFILITKLFPVTWHHITSDVMKKSQNVWKWRHAWFKNTFYKLSLPPILL